MTKSYLFTVPGLLFAAAVILFGAAMAAGEQSLADLIAQEESGIETPVDLESGPVSKAPTGNGLVTNTIPQDSVLLIPNSTDDDVGMYDPYDGHFLGILISDTTHFNLPINAIQGPDDNIYVSDQNADAIFVYDTSGTYLYTYADNTDGLDNIRGIDFRNDTLFVTTIHTYVARFVGPHNRISDFFSGAGAFDIFFMDDGRSLLSSHASPNGIRLYDVDGTYISQLFNVSFPEQTISDDLAPGGFLDAAYVGGDQITDFDEDGTIQQTTPWTYGRGVYRLGNGNLLTNSGHSSHQGVYEIEPGTGAIVELENSGSTYRFIEMFVLEGGPPPTGRCCYNDFQDCVDTTQAACTALGGVWDGALNCIDDPCPPEGRCCYNDFQDCVDTIQVACTALGGVWDADSNCASNPCPVEGRCCYNNNQSCADTTEAACLDLGGDWDDTLNCIDNPCPTGGCDYVPGDVNGSDSYNGLDITFGVAYFKGGAEPICPYGTCPIPPCDVFFYCGDVNNSCSYNGLDITYGVAYFKGGPAPMPCDDCPPNP